LEWSGSVRTGLLIIMMMFFAALALDIATLAVGLMAFVLADRAIYPLLSGLAEGRGA
jgi:hypothetical protein